MYGRRLCTNVHSTGGGGVHPLLRLLGIVKITVRVVNTTAAAAAYDDNAYFNLQQCAAKPEQCLSIRMF